MATWRESARKGVASGTWAALASAAALVLCASAKRRPPLGPLNGPSQWFWGQQAARRTQVTWRHTALGYATHHASAIFWATLHEKMYPRPARRSSVELARAGMTTVLAAFVDYALTPRRLQPGFEKQLGLPSLVTTYAAFGIGLAAGRLQGRKGVPMQRIEKIVDVDRPIGTVYNQWTQFEDFPKFMAGVKEVRQLDDTHLHWHAEVWGKEEEWTAEITEQTPDVRISWRSTQGPQNAGTVRFEKLSPEKTRVRLVMAYEPEGAVENVGSMLGAMDSQVQESVDDFKTFIESRGTETGAWRGEVHDSTVRGTKGH
jgi:uncharacterized membrane protein